MLITSVAWFVWREQDRATNRNTGCNAPYPVAMMPVSAVGLFAVTAMLVTYALESRSRWFVLAFAGACVLGSVYGFLQGAWPFGIVEAIWSDVAVRRW